MPHGTTCLRRYESVAKSGRPEKVKKESKKSPSAFNRFVAANYSGKATAGDKPTDVFKQLAKQWSTMSVSEKGKYSS